MGTLKAVASTRWATTRIKTANSLSRLSTLCSRTRQTLLLSHGLKSQLSRSDWAAAETAVLTYARWTPEASAEARRSSKWAAPCTYLDKWHPSTNIQPVNLSPNPATLVGIKSRHKNLPERWWTSQVKQLSGIKRPAWCKVGGTVWVVLWTKILGLREVCKVEGQARPKLAPGCPGAWLVVIHRTGAPIASGWCSDGHRRR